MALSDATQGDMRGLVRLLEGIDVDVVIDSEGFRTRVGDKE
jgi:hypothetical protein